MEWDLLWRQHGLFTVGQARAAGVGHSRVYRRYERAAKGVFRSPEFPITSEQRWLAAVLAAGPDAVLSHRAAAGLHGLDGIDGFFAEVTLPRLGARVGRGIHATRRLPPTDIQVIHGIAVTSVPRTLIDLSSVLPGESLAFAVESAWRRPPRPEVIEAVGERLDALGEGRRGASLLRRLLRDAVARGKPLESPLEVRMWQTLQRSSLPLPKTGWEMRDERGRMFLDFAYPQRRLAIETIGEMVHRPAFESDSERTQRLAALGWTVITVTWRQLQDDPQGVLGRIARALARFARRKRCDESLSMWRLEGPPLQRGGDNDLCHRPRWLSGAGGRGPT